MASTKGQGASEVLDSGVLAGLQVLDHKRMAEVVEIFIADTTGHLRSLRRSIHRADGLFVARKCHSLQGSSANLGASTMANLCGQLKMAGDGNDMVAGRQILRQLEIEFDRVGPALTAAF